MKSTTTVTPEVAVHAEDDALTAPAVAPVAGATTARIAIAAPMAAFMAVSSCVPGQHGVRETITDAVDIATGSVLLAIAGTDCTVANTLGDVLPGKKNAP